MGDLQYRDFSRLSAKSSPNQTWRHRRTASAFESTCHIQTARDHISQCRYRPNWPRLLYMGKRMLTLHSQGFRGVSIVLTGMSIPKGIIHRFGSHGVQRPLTTPWSLLRQSGVRLPSLGAPLFTLSRLRDFKSTSIKPQLHNRNISIPQHNLCVPIASSCHLRISGSQLAKSRHRATTIDEVVRPDR